MLLKGIFSETTYVCVFLRNKYQVSSIILTSFKEGRGTGGGAANFTASSAISKQTPKTPTQIRVKENRKMEFGVTRTTILFKIAMAKLDK